jgi:nicotinamidase-related amidase
VHPEGPMVRLLRDAGADADYYCSRLERTVIPNAQRLLAGARKADVPVIYVCMSTHRHDGRDGHPQLRGLLTQWDAAEGSWGATVHDALSPIDNDIRLMKYGSGGYYGSLLEPTLRNLGTEQIVYTGVLTDACILLHCAEGFDRGFRQWVLEDATATLTERAHENALEIMSTFMATVTSTAAIMSQLIE